MANPKTEFMRESTVLRTLTLPFRLLRLLMVVILILFGSSLVLQTYFHRPALLQEELQLAREVGNTRPLWNKIVSDRDLLETGIPLNIRVTRVGYHALFTLFFKLPQMDRVMTAQSDADFGFSIKQRFEPWLIRFNETLKIVAIRLGNIVLFLLYALFLSLIGLVDGLVARKVRQANASRESAGIYHRAKFWRTGILWGSMLLYLCLPVAVSPQWLLLPTVAISILVFVQTKYLKKYL